MAWVFLSIIGASVGCWFYFRREDESYSEFTGRHVGVFLGAVNGAIQTSKKKEETNSQDETQKGS